MDETTPDTTEAPAEESTETTPAEGELTETPAERKMREIADEEYEQFQQSSKFTKDFFETLSNDPKSVISRLMHINPALAQTMEEMLADQYMRQIQEEQLTPEQKQLRDMENELKRYKETEANSKKAQEQAEIQAEKEYIENIMVDAMELTGLPADPLLAEYARRGVQLAVNHGMQPTPQLIADYIDSKMDAIFGGRIDRLDGEDLLNALGPKTLQKVRAVLQAKAAAAQAKGTFTTPSRGQNKPTPKVSKSTFELLREANGHKPTTNTDPKATVGKTLQQMMRDALKGKA